MVKFGSRVFVFFGFLFGPAHNVLSLRDTPLTLQLHLAALDS